MDRWDPSDYKAIAPKPVVVDTGSGSTSLARMLSLYHTNYKLVVLCLNGSTGGERFLFHGSGYADAENAQYRRVIMDIKVPMARVPEEFLRYVEKLVFERSIDLQTKVLRSDGHHCCFSVGIRRKRMG